jgi:hypothetical protein
VSFHRAIDAEGMIEVASAGVFLHHATDDALFPFSDDMDGWLLPGRAGSAGG